MHLRIPKSDKQKIASKLLQGVKIDDILLSYKEDELSSNQIERKHLIKRRDILNISKKYNVNIILPKVRQPPIKKNEHLQEKTESLIKRDSSAFETEKRHIIASQLSLSFVNPINNNVWKVSIVNSLIPTYSLNEDVFHVSKSDVTCCNDDNCKSYCSSCNICYHSYSCKCSDFLTKKIICEHIHLVVLYQITPLTCGRTLTKYVDNIKRPIFNNQDHTAYTQNLTKSSNIVQLIEDEYVNEDVSENNNYKSNKLITKLENLKHLKSRLEKLMLQALQKVNECNNCDLLEDIEKRITTITCDISTDLLQSKKRSNEAQAVSDKNIEVFYVF